MPPSVKDRLQQKLKDKKEKEEIEKIEKINESLLCNSKNKSKYISMRFGDNINLNFDKIELFKTIRTPHKLVG